MKKRRYPLEPLAQVRERKVEGAVRELAQAVTARERAEAERLAQQARERAHAAKLAQVVAAEREALERGELHAADLARAHAWQLRTDAERAALQAAVDQARGAEQQSRGVEDAARGEVAARRADSDVVDKDRARWEAEGRKREEAKEEEAMNEAFRPRR